MRRLTYLRRAQRDLAELRAYITRESGSIETARDFTARLRQECRQLSVLPGTLGRARDEIEPGLRSIAWRRYVVFFRYLPDRVQILRVLHGGRDVPSVLRGGAEEA